MLGHGCRLSDRGIELMARRCPELTHLQIQNCFHVSGQSMHHLVTKCTNLQHLDVSGESIALSLYLCGFHDHNETEMRLIWFSGCTQIGSIDFNHSLNPTRRLLLQFLDLTDCCQLDDVGLKTVVQNCPQLVFLYLRRCTQISGEFQRIISGPSIFVRISFPFSVAQM